MARLNIEDSFFGDVRFIRLVMLFGCEDKAIGQCIRAWRLAQQYWLEGKKLIPENVWNGCNFSEHLFTVCLTQKQDGGVYVHGTEKHFQWWFDGVEQRREAGKKSANGRQRTSNGRWCAGSNEHPTDQPSYSYSSSLITKSIENKKISTSSVCPELEKPPSNGVGLANATPPPNGHASPKGLLDNLSEMARSKLLSLYPDAEFVEREKTKMQLWLDANGHKMPRSPAGWSRFVLGWLERGWERHRKSLSSNQSSGVDWAALRRECT